MGKLRTEQRAKLIEFYFEHYLSIVLTQRAYMRHFNKRILLQDYLAFSTERFSPGSY